METQTLLPQQKIQFRETAWKIGCSLMKESFWFNGACNWSGYWIESFNGSYQPIRRTFGPDLYSGTSGIALFLGALYEETADKLVLKTLEGTIRQMQLTKNDIPPHGFYSGRTGVAASLIRIGNQLQREELVREGRELLLSLPAAINTSHEVDVISGVAGGIPVLLDAYRQFNDEVFLEKATKLGQLLLQRANASDNSYSWATVQAHRDLTGFSHGAGGIALALLHLYTITNEPVFLAAATGGFNYERRAFVASQQNWPDYRSDVPQGENSCGYAWCHGAPGIALSRIRANELNPEAIFEQEIEVAIRTTALNVRNSLTQHLEHANYSLCHGLAGNADILLESNDEQAQRLAEMVGATGIRHFQEQNRAWPNGLNSDHPTPGLMMGLAGTGYFFLRLSDPKRYRSVLLPGI